MADVTLTLTIPDVWATRLIPFINFRAERIEATTEGQRVLTEYGASDVASLTQKQRAMFAIICDYLLRGLKGFEASEAQDAARITAETDVVDNFPVNIGS
jgi:hypothetical protein